MPRSIFEVDCRAGTRNNINGRHNYAAQIGRMKFFTIFIASLLCACSRTSQSFVQPLNGEDSFGSLKPSLVGSILHDVKLSTGLPVPGYEMIRFIGGAAVWTPERKFGSRLALYSFRSDQQSVSLLVHCVDSAWQNPCALVKILDVVGPIETRGSTILSESCRYGGEPEIQYIGLIDTNTENETVPAKSAWRLDLKELKLILSNPEGVACTFEKAPD